MIGRALSLALADAFAPAERRLLLLTVGAALLLLAALWLGASFLLATMHLSGFLWLDRAIDLLGSVAALFVAWLIFPTTAILLLGLFLDRILVSLERRHYPGLPAPRPIGLRQSLASALRLALLALVFNLLVLPLYLFFPGLNLVLFFAINGYLVGREYFETVAYRRLDTRDAKAMWRRHRLGFLAAGTIVAALLSIPLVNLAAPLVGVAFMLHLFEALRRSGA